MIPFFVSLGVSFAVRLYFWCSLVGVAAVLLGFRIQFLKLITFRLDCWKTDPFFLYLDLLEMMLGQTRFLKHIPPNMVIHSGSMFS